MTLFGITFSSSDIYLFGVAGVLFMVVIGAIIHRQNSVAVRNREERDKIIREILRPLNDAILNIEHGEHNHISIMNSFLNSQKESISRAKAIASRSKKEIIEKAWDNYEIFYMQNAKDIVMGQFMNFPQYIEEEKKNELRAHITTIIESINKI